MNVPELLYDSVEHDDHDEIVQVLPHKQKYLCLMLSMKTAMIIY